MNTPHPSGDPNWKNVAWDRTKLERFKVVITKANEAHADSIWFDGNQYVVAYGLYLIEYLEGAFQSEDENP